MKINPTAIFNTIAILIIICLLILIALPFNINNLEQAQRIALWKSKYEDMKYCFSLVNLHEKAIFQTGSESGKILSEEYFFERIKPYFNFANDSEIKSKKYRYRRMNGRPFSKADQFYFDKFLKYKDNSIISIRKNDNMVINGNRPGFYMFIDINGKKKPNRVGQDIFLISIFRDHIEPLGHDLPYAILKANCSPVMSGLYCSEYYILGGRF